MLRERLLTSSTLQLGCLTAHNQHQFQPSAAAQHSHYSTPIELPQSLPTLLSWEMMRRSSISCSSSSSSSSEEHGMAGAGLRLAFLLLFGTGVSAAAVGGAEAVGSD